MPTGRSLTRCERATLRSRTTDSRTCSLRTSRASMRVGSCGRRGRGTSSTILQGPSLSFARRRRSSSTSNCSPVSPSSTRRASSVGGSSRRGTRDAIRSCRFHRPCTSRTCWAWSRSESKGALPVPRRCTSQPSRLSHGRSRLVLLRVPPRHPGPASGAWERAVPSSGSYGAGCSSISARSSRLRSGWREGMSRGSARPDAPEFLTVAEAAELARCSTRTIRRALRAGRLRGRQPGGRGGRVLISRQDLYAWLAGPVPATEMPPGANGWMSHSVSKPLREVRKWRPPAKAPPAPPVSTRHGSDVPPKSQLENPNAGGPPPSGLISRDG